MNNTYILANRKLNNESKVAINFKKSFLGADIGIHSSNFVITIVLSMIIALVTLFGMYFMFRI